MKEQWFGYSSNKKVFERLGARLDRFLHIASSAIGTILIAISSIFLSNYTLATEIENIADAKGFLAFLYENPWLYFISGAVSLLLGAIGISKDHKNLSEKIGALTQANNELKGEITDITRLSDNRRAELDKQAEDTHSLRGDIATLHEELVRQWLINFPTPKDKKSYCRVSLYYYSEKSFTLLARYSENPRYSRMHKQRFSQNEGAISKAWQHGEWIDSDCPDYTQDVEAYLAHHKEMYLFEREKTVSFTMKSCRIFALAVKDAGIRIGVVVFESDKPDALNARVIKELKEHCAKYESNMAKFMRQGMLYDRALNLQRAPSAAIEQNDVLKSLRSAA